MSPAVDQAQVTFVHANGKKESIPSLDARRIQERGFIKYIPPLMDSDEFSSPVDEMQLFDEWKERMFYIVEDINWLLRLPHDLFWCQVIFDASLHQLLDSFLLYAPRHYDNALIKDYCQKIHSKVTKLIFLTIIRMATDQESDENYISSAVFGEIIYDNFIFDIPKLFDICSILYGKDGKNSDLLSKVIGNIFGKQPRYYDDLEASLSTIFQTIEQMSQKLGFISEESLCGPIKLPGQDGNALSTEELKDVALYLYDTSYTLQLFLAAFPPAAEVFQKFNAFSKLAFVFDSIIPDVVNRLKSSVEDRMWCLQCTQTSQCLLQVTHYILKQVFQSTPEDRACSDLHSQKLEQCVQTFSSALSYKRFLYNYDKEFDIQSEFQALSHDGSFLDDTPITFIMDAVVLARKAFGASEKATEKDDQITRPPPGFSDKDNQQMILRLKDLFPHLDDEFLRKASNHYSGNEDQVVHAILEGTLPPELCNAQSMETSSLSSQSSGTLPSRTDCEKPHEEDLKRHEGSKLGGRYYRKENEDIFSALVDKDQAKFVQDYVSNLEEKESKFDEYDDEYDDTYDSQNFGAIDADSADELDELTKRRAFVIPRVLRGPNYKATDSGDAISSEDDSKSQSPEDAEKARPFSTTENQSNIVRGVSGRGKQFSHGHAARSDHGKHRTGKSGNGEASDNDFKSRQYKGGSKEKKNYDRTKYSHQRHEEYRSHPNHTWQDKPDNRQKDLQRENTKSGRKDPEKQNPKYYTRKKASDAESQVFSNYDRSLQEPKKTGIEMNETFLESERDIRSGLCVDKQESWANEDHSNEDAEKNENRYETSQSSVRGRGARGRGQGEGGSKGRGRAKWHDKHHRKDRAAQKYSRGMGHLPRS